MTIVKTLMPALALMAPLPLHAQTASADAQTSAAAAVDPARLAAAQKLLGEMMPPERRQAMVEGMLRPMMANIQRGIMQSPQIDSALQSNPQAKPILQNYMKAQMEQAITMLRENMPGMVDAIAHAYARRFDAKQLADLRKFFATPTGKAYLEKSITIMSDPDVAAWQQKLMKQSMQHAQQDTKDLVAKLKAANSKNGSQ
ncbi:DUF2059 domain-containing protein [Stakelama marina]|uniref:DUF2059 domain-containing protein n=1 Tax=Stakelama marina TaxID=2826939 RepID=A0A8T4IF71_9SPHN|nr:DUF2059 domain-containing protein [Stakelama marina]MBR0553210.1 DUF2059 domain-containing protein [Stakelama marina]